MAFIAAMLAVFVALVVPQVPRTMRVSYRLPAGVRSLAVDYESDGELARSARFRWSGDSPEVVRHEPELADGWYVIVATIDAERTGLRQIRRSTKIEHDRVTRVDLRETR